MIYEDKKMSEEYNDFSSLTLKLEISEDQYLEFLVSMIDDEKKFTITHRWNNPNHGQDFVVDNMPIEIAEKIKVFLNFAV